jgi:hypothetical protein
VRPAGFSVYCICHSLLYPAFDRIAPTHLLERQRPACLRRKGHFLPWLRQLRRRASSACRRSAPGPTSSSRPVARPPRWTTHFVAAERPGYSGVGLFSRKPRPRRHLARRPRLRQRGPRPARPLRRPRRRQRLLPQRQRPAIATTAASPTSSRSTATCSTTSASCAAPAAASSCSATSTRPTPTSTSRARARTPSSAASSRGARRADALARRRLGRHVPPLQPRARPLLVVVAAGVRTRPQHRLAPRLRARVPGRGPVPARRGDPPGGHRLRPLPRQRRRRPRHLRPHTARVKPPRSLHPQRSGA